MNTRGFCWCRPNSLLIVTFMSMLLFLGDVSADGNVTLLSLTIYQNHQWLGKANVYFRCQGEQKVYLPDVTEKDHEYTFIGEESWQPLTALIGSKCKRCGLYEEDLLKHDDVFDEWELCPISFSPKSFGVYNHFKDNEFNMTLLCGSCHPTDESKEEEMEEESKESSLNTVLLVFIFISMISGVALFAYMRWQKKKREEQQLKFIKLFEDDDELEAELGLRD